MYTIFNIHRRGVNRTDDGYSVKIKTISASVYEKLREMILTGYFRPGQWLRERELVELVEVSRTPVREALRLLEQERLLESIPHRGFRIPVLNEQEVCQFFELREELEGFAAKLAAQRASPEDVDKIGVIVEGSWQVLGDDNQQRLRLIQQNNHFHHSVATAGGNLVLSQSLDQLRAGVNLHRILVWSQRENRPADTLMQHQLIYEAIRDGDEDLALSRARKHIRDSWELALEAIRDVESEDAL